MTENSTITSVSKKALRDSLEKERRFLFVLKHRDVYYSNELDSSKPLSSGLLNSASQIVWMLASNAVDTKIVSVVDNNKIDAEVFKFKPTHVVIEALWVVPEKFEILQKLHPTVTWYVRLHSEIPFIANEGIAMDWIFRYLGYKNVFIGINSKKMLNDMRSVIPKELHHKLVYQPNYYWNNPVERRLWDDGYFHIGCFGAIRPLKNHLAQAIASINFARETGRKLKFHINASRVENNGENIIKNLRGLFESLNDENYVLVEHPWADHSDFVKLVASMDLCVQVSFTETFNIVTADAVCNNVPVLVSKDINWVFPFFSTNSTDVAAIVSGLRRCTSIFGRLLKVFNKLCLSIHNDRAKSAWLGKPKKL